MKRKAQIIFAERARILKALAHPTRLFMVEELARGERCVCELRDMVGADISTISKHLSLLKWVGIVQDEKRGTQVYYRLRCPCVLQFFDCIEAVMRSVAQARRETVGRKILQRNG